MIESIVVRNFQRHEKYKLTFDPHITVLAGASRAGKSALFRALRWAAMNDPAGDEFVRHGTDLATVKVRVDGNLVVRSKGRGVNSYRVGDKILEAFGQSVPADVASLLKLGDINFQAQFDAPYWVCSSPSEVSRELNKIVNLDCIDKTMTNLAATARRATADTRAAQDRLIAAEKQTSELAWARIADAKLKVIEDAHAHLAATDDAVARLHAVACELDELQRAAEMHIPDTTEMARIADALRVNVSELTALTGAAVDVERAKSAYRIAKQRWETAQAAWDALAKTGCPVCGNPEFSFDGE